jgi:FKBP-type peptidyl-prolyl cis-trans isomerase FkpA
MLQKKYVALAGVIVVVVGLASGGFVLWHKQQRGNNSAVSFGGSSQFVGSETNGTSSTYANGQNIPLTPSSSSSGGLSADSSPSSGNLGQLSIGQNSSGSNGASSSGQGTPSSGSSGGSSSGPTIDPSTFSQYDKYQGIDPTTGKPYAGALFGDVQVGTGTALTSSGQKASVYYKGWLTNGTLFDESRADSSGQLQPFTFTAGANQVITCWEQGVAGMKVGGTRLLVCPPSVAYGAAGQPPSIPPNSVLVFEVQLLAVN